MVLKIVLIVIGAVNLWISECTLYQTGYTHVGKLCVTVLTLPTLCTVTSREVVL